MQTTIERLSRTRIVGYRTQTPRQTVKFWPRQTNSAPPPSKLDQYLTTRANKPFGRKTFRSFFKTVRINLKSPKGRQHQVKRESQRAAVTDRLTALKHFWDMPFTIGYEPVTARAFYREKKQRIRAMSEARRNTISQMENSLIGDILLSHPATKTLMLNTANNAIRHGHWLALTPWRLKEQQLMARIYNETHHPAYPYAKVAPVVSKLTATEPIPEFSFAE
jgi:hypothetical protein